MHNSKAAANMVIGIDIASIDRFKSSKHLNKFISRFNIDGNTPGVVAKTWACLEAIIKAESSAFNPTDIKIRFPKNSAPVVIDTQQVLQYQYQLSVSHEGSMVAAVALGTQIVAQD